MLKGERGINRQWLVEKSECCQCDIGHILIYIRDKTSSPIFGLFCTRYHLIVITYTKPLNIPKAKHI